MIDNFHRDEQTELEEDLDQVKGEMRDWQKKCQEPVNFEVFVFSKMQQLEKKKQRKLQFEEQLKDCDTVMKTKEKLAELQDLCQHYGMQDFVKDKIKLTDRQLID